jgi:hypothetical protein
VIGGGFLLAFGGPSISRRALWQTGEVVVNGYVWLKIGRQLGRVLPIGNIASRTRHAGLFPNRNADAAREETPPKDIRAKSNPAELGRSAGFSVNATRCRAFQMKLRTHEKCETQFPRNCLDRRAAEDQLCRRVAMSAAAHAAWAERSCS